MRVLIGCVLAIAALGAVRAEEPQPATSMRTPTVTLAASMGWRLDAVVMIDLVADVPVLVIGGDVINASSIEREAPTVRFGLRDRDRREFFHWTVKLDQPVIRPGDWAPFETRLERPPAETHSVEIQTIDVLGP